MLLQKSSVQMKAESFLCKFMELLPQVLTTTSKRFNPSLVAKTGDVLECPPRINLYFLISHPLLCAKGAPARPASSRTSSVVVRASAEPVQDRRVFLGAAFASAAAAAVALAPQSAEAIELPWQKSTGLCV